MFTDRQDAGQQLATRLSDYVGRRDVVVVGLPRGGVPVAREVASFLDAPLDVIVVRKLGMPSRPELAMGAIGEHGVRYLDEGFVARAGVSKRQIEEVEQRERQQLDARVERLRFGREPIPLVGRTVIVVDDGVATGATARVACTVARHAGADRVVLATPVAPADWTERLSGVADEFVAVSTPSRFRAVGFFYRDFAEISDEEVIDVLISANDSRP